MPVVLLVDLPANTALSLLGSAVAALAYDDQVRCGGAASLGVGAQSKDNVHGDAAPLGVGTLVKDDAGDGNKDALPPCACVAC